MKKKEQDKYRFQKKWQEKNGYISKSYRIDSDVLENLLDASFKMNKSQAAILREALCEYIQNDFCENFNDVYAVIKSRIDKKAKKTFKIKKETTNIITAICDENKFNQGSFVSAILECHFKK